MSYCKICIQNDKKKKRLFDLFTDKFKCEDEGRFLYRCKDCWQYSLALYSYVYINKEKCDNFLFKKVMSEGAQTAILHENICERAKKHNNLALCSCWLTNRIVVTTYHFCKSLSCNSYITIKIYFRPIVNMIQAFLNSRLLIISDTRNVF